MKSLLLFYYGIINIIMNYIGSDNNKNAEMDLDYLASVRKQIPTLKNRRKDIYKL